MVDDEGNKIQIQDQSLFYYQKDGQLIRAFHFGHIPSITFYSGLRHSNPDEDVTEYKGVRFYPTEKQPFAYTNSSLGTPPSHERKYAPIIKVDFPGYRHPSDFFYPSQHPKVDISALPLYEPQGPNPNCTAVCLTSILNSEHNLRWIKNEEIGSHAAEAELAIERMNHILTEYDLGVHYKQTLLKKEDLAYFLNTAKLPISIRVDLLKKGDGDPHSLMITHYNRSNQSAIVYNPWGTYYEEPISLKRLVAFSPWENQVAVIHREEGTAPPPQPKKEVVFLE